MRFLAIGECMAELAPSDQDGNYKLGFAGDTFNTAWYLARCAPQIDVSFLTVVGNDSISSKLRDCLLAGGISDRFVGTSNDKTVGLYLISLDAGERSFSYWRGQSAARMLADDEERMFAALVEADMIYFSGITLAILDPDRRTALIEALKVARASGRVVAFDPNLRPSLWPSGTEMVEAVMEGAAVSDLVLPSFEDEAVWFGDADPKATAKRYLSAGAITVIVKNGAGPIYYAEPATSGNVPVQPVDVLVDSTAAGDSFNAGIFAQHAACESITAGISFACALSRQVIQQKGALVPVSPTIHESRP